MQASEIHVGETYMHEGERVKVLLPQDVDGVFTVQNDRGCNYFANADDLSPLPPAQAERETFVVAIGIADDTQTNERIRIVSASLDDDACNFSPDAEQFVEGPNWRIILPRIELTIDPASIPADRKMKAVPADWVAHAPAVRLEPMTIGGVTSDPSKELGLPAPDPDAEDKAACAEPDKIVIVNDNLPDVSVCISTSGDGMVLKQSGDVVVIRADMLPELRAFADAHFPAPTPPASPPAPVQVDVEGIVEKIAVRCSELHFTMGYLVSNACEVALREHLPALADGARLMRLVMAGGTIQRINGGDFHAYAPPNNTMLIDSRTGRVQRFSNAHDARAAAEQIGGA